MLNFKILVKDILVTSYNNLYKKCVRYNPLNTVIQYSLKNYTHRYNIMQFYNLIKKCIERQTLKARDRNVILHATSTKNANDITALNCFGKIN